MPSCTVCRILVPQPGMEPGSTAVKALSPNYWTPRIWFFFFFNKASPHYICFYFIHVWFHQVSIAAHRLSLVAVCGFSL